MNNYLKIIGKKHYYISHKGKPVKEWGLFRNKESIKKFLRDKIKWDIEDYEIGFILLENYSTKFPKNIIPLQRNDTHL